MRLAILIVLTWVCAASGQELLQKPPVDQTVSDLDPLGTSLRWVEPGNAQFSNRVRLYRLDESGVDPATGLIFPGQYLYRSPGVQARLDRPQYLSLSPFSTPNHSQMVINAAPAVDGAFIEMIPPNTFFDLVLRPDPRSSPANPYGDQSQANGVRMNTRIDTRIDSRIDGRVTDSWLNQDELLVDLTLDPASPQRLTERSRAMAVELDTPQTQPTASARMNQAAPIDSKDQQTVPEESPAD